MGDGDDTPVEPGSSRQSSTHGARTPTPTPTATPAELTRRRSQAVPTSYGT
jgi:hypothetical protein